MGVTLEFINSSHFNTVSIISAVSGVITEFISSIFFALHSRTVQQMKEYHNNLLNTQNILLSFTFIESTNNESEKSKMIGQMLASLINKQEQTSEKK